MSPKLQELKQVQEVLDALPENWKVNQRGNSPLDITDVLEAVCPHGVGHPIVLREERDGMHGCDGCCMKIKVLDLRPTP